MVLKRKYRFFLLIFFWSSKLFAQVNTIEVEYKNIVMTPKGERYTFIKTLRDNGQKSIFLSKDTIITNNNLIIPVDLNKDKGLFIDKLSNVMYQYNPVLNKDYYVKEDSISINWSFNKDKQKTILGYVCKFATSYFRGRTYEVYYTEDLPFFTGPWKLSGLPGVILEARTIDGLFKFEAFKISQNVSFPEIRNPYDLSKITFISFKDHKKLLLKKIQDLQRKAQSKEKDEDVTYSVEDNSMELMK